MDLDNPVIVVAIVAAAASIVGAVVAAVASVRATRGARGIASLSHRIAQLDDEADQLRQDFRAFMAAFGDATSTKAMGPLMAACEVLCANPRANAEVVTCADRIRATLQKVAIENLGAAVAVRLSGEDFRKLRASFAASIRAIADERSRVLAKRH